MTKQRLAQAFLVLSGLGMGLIGALLTPHPSPVALGAPGTRSAGGPPLPSPVRRFAAPISMPESARQLFGLTNTARAQAKLPLLTWDPQLAAAAEAHATSMGREDFYAHTGADGTPTDRILAFGFPKNAVWGEIIAAAYPTPEHLFRVLWALPGCRSRILQTDVTHIGIGAMQVPGSRWVWYWTLDTGARG